MEWKGHVCLFSNWMGQITLLYIFEIALVVFEGITVGVIDSENQTNISNIV